MGKTNPLQMLEPVNRPSVADTVFEELHRQILSLELPPGTKMSEVDVSEAMDISRQPVRDAFYRLSKLGFLTIRPHRATTVSLISMKAVSNARFVRAAIEIETARVASEKLTDEDILALEALLEEQRVASDASDFKTFHDLDDQLHREICERSGNGFVWEIIREKKAHMDRVRQLTLAVDSATVWEDHVAIVKALRARDPELAAQMMREHLTRILSQAERIQAKDSRYFEEN